MSRDVPNQVTQRHNQVKQSDYNRSAAAARPEHFNVIGCPLITNGTMCGNKITHVSFAEGLPVSARRQSLLRGQQPEGRQGAPRDAAESCCTGTPQSRE